MGTTTGLIPFQKGKSGNPGGRSKVNRTFQELCRSWQPDLAKELRHLALNRKSKHQMRAIELILAYDLGRPAVNVNVRTIRRFEDLTDEELKLLGGENATIEGEVVDENANGDGDAGGS